VESTGGVLDPVKAAIKEAFRLTIDGFSLPARLEKIRLPPSELDIREIREVNKIANYWRICIYFAHLSRSYRSRFGKLQLDIVEPYGPSTALKSSMKKFVHAEIQMLVFYEISQPPPWPRMIGASKEACFLCNSFIKAHGCFYLSKAHCQLFPQWTVPDLELYSAKTLSRLQSGLVTVHQDVSSALKRARCRPNFRPFPLQSSVNLDKMRLPTPSITTVHSHAESTDVANIVSLDKSSPNTEQIGNHSPRTFDKSSMLSDCNTISGISEQIQLPIAGLSASTSNVALGEPSFCGWLHLYVSFDNEASEANISLEPVQNYSALGPCVDSFDVGDLALGEEAVLSHPISSDGDRGNEMNIVFTNQGKVPMLMRCRWNYEKHEKWEEVRLGPEGG
jgi:hypothetical protein